MTDFAIYIPRIEQYFTTSDIIDELSCYGYITSVQKVTHNNYQQLIDKTNAAIVKFSFTIPIDKLNGRTLKEDIIYRETNKVKPFIHWSRKHTGGLALLRNLEPEPINPTFTNKITDYMVNEDGIYAAGL